MTIATCDADNDKPHGPVRVAVYASASINQAGPGSSLQSQMIRLRRKCCQLGWIVVAEYTDVRAPESARPGFDALTAAAGQNPRLFDKVLVEDIAKVSRDSLMTARCIKMFENLGAPIALMQSAEDDGEGWLVRSIMAMCDEQSSKQHSQRVKRGIADARARRAADVIDQTKPTKVPCQHCAGLGWAEAVISSANVSEFAVED